MVDAKKRGNQLVSREYTINLHKKLHRCTFKKCAPKAIKMVKEFANKAMKTKEARIDTSLNKLLWSKGVRNVPRRVRVIIQRKRNDDDDAKEDLYSYVTVAAEQNFAGLGTKQLE